MKKVEVVAAIIRKDKRIFVAERGYGEFAGQYELPGGKVETGETPEQAIVREIKEELATDIQVDRYVTTVEYDYPTFHLSMRCYLCHVLAGHLTLLEHTEAAWVDGKELVNVNWLPADRELVGELQSLLAEEC